MLNMGKVDLKLRLTNSQLVIMSAEVPHTKSSWLGNPAPRLLFFTIKLAAITNLNTARSFGQPHEMIMKLFLLPSIISLEFLAEISR